MSPKLRKGFTLIELMVVVVIIGVLSAISISMFRGASEKAKYAQSRIWLKRMYQALEEFYYDCGCYPHDVSRNTPPPGLVPEYLEEWPRANRDPFGAVYDYEAQDDGDGLYWIGITYLAKDKQHSHSFDYWREHGVPGVIMEMDGNDDLHMFVTGNASTCE